MTLYQVQIDNQARPVYVKWEGDPLKEREPIILKTDHGPTYAEVLEQRTFLQPCLAHFQVFPLLRSATEEDLKRRARHRQVEREAFLFCRDNAKTLGLDMKVVSVNMALDESHILFVYTSEERVDFRDLVRTLARKFHLRIEMRQVGVRDEAKLLGGYGHCGRPLCCASHLRQFYPITIRMAKEQGLSLNPAKISGRCGRLMCCLRYEPASGGKRGSSSGGTKG